MMMMMTIMMTIKMTLMTTLNTQVPHYLAAQYLGAFTASAAVFLVYWDALVW